MDFYGAMTRTTDGGLGRMGGQYSRMIIARLGILGLEQVQDKMIPLHEGFASITVV